MLMINLVFVAKVECGLPFPAHRSCPYICSFIFYATIRH